MMTRTDRPFSGKLFGLVALSVLLIIIVTWYFNYANDARLFAMIQDRVGHLSIALEGYVNVHHEFPSNLGDALGGEASATPLLVPLPGEDFEYLPPKAEAPPTTPVIVVRFRNKQITVFKDFNRVTTRSTPTKMKRGG
jgi:hypothetical protein